ncbi:MAG: class II fructose-bisphosphate aldolase [Aurantimicrobium sp.]
MLENAQSKATGVGAFNVLHLETAEALVAAAELSGLPLILQISENCVNYHGGLDPIAQATITLASQSSGQLAVHLDHAEDLDLAFRAIDLGFSSVMYDGSHLDDLQNISNTRSVVEYAHGRGVFVEAELGRIGGKGHAHDLGVLTDPDEARDFVNETGVDALAIAVGSSHAMSDRSAVLNLERIGEIHSSVSVPLVLHGSSGVRDEHIKEAIVAGITKINVSTHLNRVFTKAVRETLQANPDLVDSRKYLTAGRTALGEEAQRLAELFATDSERP